MREIGDRREAIRGAVAELQRGDVLLIAGKGHETGQIVGEQVLPISATTRRSQAALAGEGGMSAPLWTVEAMAAGDGAPSAQGALPHGVTGLSIDTRTIAAGRGVLRHLKDDSATATISSRRR